MRSRFLIVPLIVVMTALVYWDAAALEFVNFDDPRAVSTNPLVRDGLGWDGIVGAFTRGHRIDGNWMPLTWLSLALDATLFGTQAGGFHVHNVALHAVNAVLLYLVLEGMTGAPWKSGFVAALFAVHPLHVESVAWVSERKDVLSTLFGFLALGAYVRYARQPERNQSGRVWLLGALVAFLASLMSKQMLVTLPFLLLVLDYWPLGRMPARVVVAGQPDTPARFPQQPLVRLLVEKIPFLVMTIAFSAIAFFAQQRAGTVSSLAQRTLQTRVSNAIVAYGDYLRMTFWPIDLAIFYPYSEQGIPAREVALAGGVLLVCTAIAVFQWRRRPYLVVGWLWYLGTLVPVIGFVQIGLQRMADRYTYVPIVGIFIAVTWWLPSLFQFAVWRRVVMPAVGATVVVACAILGHAQVEHWRDSEALFAHAVEVTDSNAVARNFLGEALLGRDDAAGALDQFDAALAIQPNFTLAVFNRARALQALGRPDEAIAALETAVELDPSHVGHTVLADAYRDAGRIDDAIQEYQAALKLNPRYVAALTNLANVLRDRGELEEAVRHYRRSLDADPNNVITHSNLGTTLLGLGQTDDGLLHLRRAVGIDPDHLTSRVNLGIALCSIGDYAGAIEQLEPALAIDPGNATATEVLAEARRNLERTRPQERR